MSAKTKVIIDTNILISGIFWGGKPYKILEKWQKKEIEVFISVEILEEYIEVINRIGKDKTITEEWRKHIVKNTTLIEVKPSVRFSRDDSDDKFLWCAIGAKADYLISGDNDLLTLDNVGKTRILTPSDFLKCHAL